MIPRARLVAGIAAVLLLAAAAAPAQTFPLLVRAGGVFHAPADSGSFFVLSRGQFDRAVLAAESLSLADSTITALEDKAALLGRIIVEQRGIIDVRTEGYEHYRDLWTQSDRQLEDAEVEVDKLKHSRSRWIVGGAVAVGLAFVAGLAVH